MPPRLKNEHFVERVVFGYDHASPTVDTDATHKLWTVPTGRKFKLLRAWYNNPTGLAGHPTIFYAIHLRKGSTTMASWSTDSDVVGQGTLAANTPVDLVKSATAADLLAAAGDVISLFLDANGTPVTLPAGRITIEGELL